MEAAFILALIARWLHILAAITAVGGTIFARLVVVPSLETLPAEQRGALHAVMRARWSKVVAGAIGFLLISGLYNFINTVALYRLPKWYHPVFGVKFLLALAVFMIASFLSGKTSVAEAMRRKLTFWLNVNILLAVLIVCLSGILRTAERIPKDQAPPAPAASENPGNAEKS